MAAGPISVAFVELRPQLSADFETKAVAAVKGVGNKIERSFDSTADAIEADSKRAGDSIDRELRGGADRAGGALGNLKGIMTGVVATVVATKGLEFMKGAISSASDLGETLSKIETQIGGPAAEAVEKFANSAAKSLGQSRQEALDTIGTFNTFGKAAGLAGSDVANFSIEFDKLAVDLASFNNTLTGEAAEALGAALRGEGEAIRRFGVLLNEDTLAAQALADGMIKPTKNAPAISKALKAMQADQDAFNKATKAFGPDSAQAQAALDKFNTSQAAFGAAAKGNVPALSAQQKILATQASIFKQTSDAQGDAVRTAGALAGQQKRLGAVFADAKQNIGAVFLPLMSQAVTTINDKVIPAIMSMVEFFKENIEIIKKVATVIAAILIPHLIRLGIEATISAAKQVAAWIATKAAAISSTFVAIAQFTIQIAKWIALGIAATVNAAIIAAAWLISLGPIALVVAAVVAAAALIILNWDKIKNAALAVWNYVKEQFTKLVDFVSGLPGKISSAASGMWDGIKNAFKSAINWIIDKWNGLEFKVPGIAGFGGFTLGTPNIPRFHSGGVYNAPFGQSEGLALLRDKETVLAPGQSAGAVFGPGAVQVTFTGALPTPQQAQQVGYAVGLGVEDAMARRALRRAGRIS